MSDLKNFLNKQAPDSKAQAPDSAAGAGDQSEGLTAKIADEKARRAREDMEAKANAIVDEQEKKDSEKENPDLESPTAEEQQAAEIEFTAHQNSIAGTAEDVDFPFSRQYTSHPISNYGIGRFVFEKGLLILTNEHDVDEFEAMLAEQPEIERSRIKPVNLTRAEEISRQFQRQGGATKQIDSTTGDRGVKPMTGKGSMELGDRGEVK